MNHSTLSPSDARRWMHCPTATPIQWHVVQYRHGKFDCVLSGMGKNRGTLDSAHSRRAAQRHAQQLRNEPWRAQSGLTYQVERTS